MTTSLYPIDTILVTTDLSPAAEIALSIGNELAIAHEATVHLVHVVEQLPFATSVMPLPTLYMKETLDQLRTSAKNALTELAEERFADRVPVIVTVLDGLAADSIVAHARELHASMIVVASHGRSGIKRLVLGSIAEKITRDAPCPVLVTPSAMAEEAAEDADASTSEEVASNA